MIKCEKNCKKSCKILQNQGRKNNVLVEIILKNGIIG